MGRVKIGLVGGKSELLGDVLSLLGGELDRIQEMLDRSSGNLMIQKEAQDATRRVERVLDALWRARKGCLVDELIDALNRLSPPFCYFGSYRGVSGEHYGFWPDWVKVHRAIRDGSVVRMWAWEKWPADELKERPGVVGVLCVGENGYQAALYEARADRPFVEVWQVG